MSAILSQDISAEPVFGIAARLPATGRFTECGADALWALLRLMTPEHACAAPETEGSSNDQQGFAREALARSPAVSRESLSGGRAESFSLRTRLGCLPALITLEFWRDAESLAKEAPEELVLRGMPRFVVGADFSEAVQKAEPSSDGLPTILIRAGEGTENIMCALSLEDAARFWKIPATLDCKTPLRTEGSRAGVYGRALTQPGSCAFLTVSGGTPASCVDALLRTMEKGADILERRLDAARAGVAEGRALEKRLLATISHAH